jgi:chromosome partitioning protein
MILLVGGEKGGVGKSLIAVSLATMRALEGYDVLVIDADRQASATLWSNIRVADQIRPAVACVEKRGEGLGAAVKDLATRYDDVVIDAGGQDSVELRAGLTVADVVLFPWVTVFSIWGHWISSLNLSTWSSPSIQVSLPKCS